MKDRISKYPGRVKLNPVAGQTNTYDMLRADEPIEEGTPINKANLDKYLAASGTTTGTASALILNDADFSLFDGALVRFKLHTMPIPNPKVTLNVNGTGAKPIVNTRGKPLKSVAAGNWVTAAYSSSLGNFILQGEGGEQAKYGNDVGQISTFELAMMGFNPYYTK